MILELIRRLMKVSKISRELTRIIRVFMTSRLTNMPITKKRGSWLRRISLPAYL